MAGWGRMTFVVSLAALRLLPATVAAQIGGGPAAPTPSAALLARPLLLPTLAPGSACPRSEGRLIDPDAVFAAGPGPLFAAGLGPDSVINRERGRFFSKVVWIAKPSYPAATVVRGQRLDGPGDVTFPTTLDQANPPTTLSLIDNLSIRFTDGSYLSVPAAGCYGLQIDGPDFSETVVFQAVDALPQDLTPVPSFRGLPRDLETFSALPLPDGTVRLAIGGEGLTIRLDAIPANIVTPRSGSRPTTTLTTAIGPIEWTADQTYGWPDGATWTAAGWRYRLEVLNSAASGWSTADLRALVEAFAAAARGWQPPAGSSTAGIG